MFIDELDIHIKAGHGGDGVVRWLHERAREFGGPSGGNGGKGGDVYIRGSRDLNLLARYRHTKSFTAEDGQDGRNKSQHGEGGEDLYIDLPVGSVVMNLSTGQRSELVREGETVRILLGGNGGLGNEHFKSSVNRRPQESTPGKPGQEADFHIEIELVADAGFIGFPNAGKSSLLNALTNSQSKVANYAFTTLDPHLGTLYGFVLADIPGLIEGASKGKGLGDKFLRHVERTHMLIHCIASDTEDVSLSYETIRNELSAFDPSLLEKDELVVLTKSDLVSVDELASKKAALERYDRQVVTVTVLDDDSAKAFQDTLIALLNRESK